MADPKQLEILKSGAQKWNDWRREHLDFQIDLRGADLERADLRRADLEHADLTGVRLENAALNGAMLNHAVLTGAYFREARLRWAKLTGADLTEAQLNYSDLTETILRGADLSRADLAFADLSRALLTSTNLCEVELRETVLGNVDLSKTIGLDSCRHTGPSVLDYRTLLRSGPLPLPFLRGCGLPDNLIDYLPSLLGTAINFYSCFISYSTDDQDFAQRLHNDLQSQGVRCWFAPHDIQGGKKIHEQIDEAIRLYDKLLLILSPASMNSEWVKTEIAKARKREVRGNRRMLFPLRLVDLETLRNWECFDGDTGKDSAREIREYFIPDFSAWKTDHDAYKKAFDRLLRDLKAEKEAVAGS